MAYVAAVCIVVVAVAVMIYTSLPPPELSPTLKQWVKRGSFLKFNDHNIFYVGMDHVELLFMLSSVHGLNGH